MNCPRYLKYQKKFDKLTKLIENEKDRKKWEELVDAREKVWCDFVREDVKILPN
jgi:hypothetical protein